MENLDLLIEKFKEAKEVLQKSEETLEKKIVSPDAKAHALSDASRAAAKPAPAKVVQPSGVADRGPARAQKDMDWLHGTGTHGVTAGAKPPGFVPGGATRHVTPDVPAGHGRDIPGFEKEEISFSKSGQWSLGKAVNMVNSAGVADDGV